MKTIVILAGGNSRRMGKDKLFLTYQDSSFLGHLTGKAFEVFDRVLISAGSEEHAEIISEYLTGSALPAIPSFPEIIIDNEPDLGPIGGLLSVFDQTDLDRFAVIAADIPEADMQVLANLLDRLEQKASDSRCFAVMLQLDPAYPEPCVAAYDRSSYPMMRLACSKGIRSLVKALGPDRIEMVTAEQLQKSDSAFTEPDLKHAFRNINTPEDYRSLSIK